MIILGNIIKSVLEITDLVRPGSSPVKDQKDILTKLLKKAKDTAFGKKYNFAGILKSEQPPEAFALAVPYFDYDRMHNQWWKRQMQGESDITWPGKAQYYARSAGTTGKDSKLIPVTNEMLEAIRKTGMLQILALSNFNLPADFFEKEIMMLGSSTSLDMENDYLVGEISGIAAGNIPGWFERYYRPGQQIASLSDFDEKVDAIARKATEWDIGAMAGLPSWNELMLRRIIEVNKVDNIHQVWPNLRLFASGGVPFTPYRKTFDALTEKPMTYIDTYLASEGFIAYQAQPDEEMAMTLSTNSGLYFEFVPFLDENIDENGSVKPGVRPLTLEQVEDGVDYVLILSSVAGAWRYMIGDTIRFTSREKAEIIISGRTKHYLNVVGSQLSVMQMNEGIKMLQEKYQLLIPEFTVAAVKKPEGYIHHWYLGCEDPANERELAESLDVFLKGINKSYNDARRRGVKRVELTLVSPAAFYAWNEQEQKKGGQVKMPRVMKEEEFARWEAFVTDLGR